MQCFVFRILFHLELSKKGTCGFFIGETSPLLSNLRVASLVDAQATLRQDPFQGVLKVEVIADTLQAKCVNQVKW